MPRRDFAREQSRRARQRARELANSFQFWFRRKYNLSPLDPRFLELTPEDVEAEYRAHQILENPSSEEFEDDDFDDELRAILGRLENDEEWENVIDERS